MSYTTIQIRVVPSFKDKIKEVAADYDLPLATFIKILIGDFIRAKRNLLATSLKNEELKEIDLAYKDYLKAKKERKLKPIEFLFKDAGFES